MFNRTQTIVGDATFEGKGGVPLIAASVGLGYLKHPLRYLTRDDIRNMSKRSGHTGSRVG